MSENDENPPMESTSEPEPAERTIARLHARLMLAEQERGSILGVANLRGDMIEAIRADLEMLQKEHSRVSHAVNHIRGMWRIFPTDIETVFGKLTERIHDAVEAIVKLPDELLALPEENRFSSMRHRTIEISIALAGRGPKNEVRFWCPTCKRHVAREDIQTTRRGFQIHYPGCGLEAEEIKQEE